MPAYNASPFIGEAITSALGQTYREFELLIWDDGSTDGTADVVRRFRDKRIRLFSSSENGGQARATNAALRLARGEFIKFLDADDILENDCVERLLAVMESNSSVGLVFARRRVQDERPLPERTDHPEPYRGLGELEELNDGAVLFERLMAGEFKQNFIGEPTNVMIRRDRLARYGLCNTQVRFYVDLDLWSRTVHDCLVGFVDAKLWRYRFHRRSLTARVAARGLHWLDTLWLLEGLATMPRLWTRYPALAAHRAASRTRLASDLAWLARNRHLQRHHLADAARYAGYLGRAGVGRAPRIIGRF